MRRPIAGASWPLQAALTAMAALAVGVGSALVLFGDGDADGIAVGSGSTGLAGQVVARDVVLSSGGYNTFAGAWLDPVTGAVMTSFVNVTGPAAPGCVRPGVPPRCDERGFRGAEHRFVLLRSADGVTWERVRRDEELPPAAPHAFSAQPVTALRERHGTPAGTLLRRVNGEDITRFPEFQVPGTAFLQRLEPDRKRWSGRTFLLDPRRFTANISRIERLRDGRTLVALGAFWKVPAGQRLQTQVEERAAWLLMTSTDEGRTWRSALAVPTRAAAAAPANEWDVAELAGGDLLAVMRTREGRRPVRKQVVLRRTTRTIATTTGQRTRGGWVMGMPAMTPPGFAQAEAPQHPDLLAVDRGAGAGGILHVADEGIHFTDNGGRTWNEVPFTGRWTPHYYPNSVQATDGDIFVFSHAGSDEDYTSAADKPVYADRIRLAETGAGR